MKIIVDKLPETPRDCLFSQEIENHAGMYGCTLRPYIEKVDGKPNCICKSVNKCDCLVFIGDAMYK